MAKMSKKTTNNVTTKKTTSTYETVPMTTTGIGSQSTGSQQISAGNQNISGVGILEKPKATSVSNIKPVLTHEQIAQRAREIWRRKGCPAGQDEQNWLEAEAELKKEMGIK